MNVDLRRIRPAELAAMPAAVLLAVSLFLPWFEFAAGRESPWRGLTFVAALAALTVLAALALAATTITQRAPALPLAFAVATTLLALLCTVLIAVYAAALPAGAYGRCYGLWLGLGGAAAVLAAAWRSLRDERPFWGVPVSR